MMCNSLKQIIFSLLNTSTTSTSSSNQMPLCRHQLKRERKQIRRQEKRERKEVGRDLKHCRRGRSDCCHSNNQQVGLVYNAVAVVGVNSAVETQFEEEQAPPYVEYAAGNAIVKN